MAIFKQSEHVAVPVTRCPTHYQNHQGKKDIPPDHLICVEGMDKVFYVQHPTSNRHSVFMPFCLPQVGCDYTTLMCSFMCNTSCTGGMNRRPIMLLLTLENSNWDVIGRCCIDVRICASPGRDRISDEMRLKSVHPEEECSNVKNENPVAQKRETTKRVLEPTMSDCKEFVKVEHKRRINEGDLVQNRKEGKNPTFPPLHDIVRPVLDGNVETNSPRPANGYCLQVQDEKTYKIMKNIALAVEIANKLPLEAIKEHQLGHELSFHLSTPSSSKELCTIRPKGLPCNGGEASNPILTCTLWPPDNTNMDGSLACLLKKIGCADCIHFFTSKNLSRTCQLRTYNRELYCCSVHDEDMARHTDYAVLEAIFNPGTPFGDAFEVGETEDALEENGDQSFDVKLVEEAKALEWRGVACAEDGNIEEAISLFSRAIRLLPTRASAYNNLAQALRLQGDDTEAMANLDKAIELSRGRGPAACQAFVQRGLIHRLNGQDGAALHDLRRAAALGAAIVGTHAEK
uniref:tumor protein 63-like isoform X2 n=1 Tax=Myxine glutinosa TaxID=7769 RepID=UPI00358F8967